MGTKLGPWMCLAVPLEQQKPGSLLISGTSLLLPLKWHHLASRFYSVLTQAKYSSPKLFETTFHFRSLNVLFITADEKLKNILTVSSTQPKHSSWHLDPIHFDLGGYRKQSGSSIYFQAEAACPIDKDLPKKLPSTEEWSALWTDWCVSWLQSNRHSSDIEPWSSEMKIQRVKERQQLVLLTRADPHTCSSSFVFSLCVLKTKFPTTFPSKMCSFTAANRCFCSYACAG